MKTNKFNQSQLKGYYNNFTYKVELLGVNNEYHKILTKVYNPNNVNVAEYITHVVNPRKKIFHRILKRFVLDVERYIESLIRENYVDDDCFTRSCTFL